MPKWSTVLFRCKCIYNGKIKQIHFTWVQVPEPWPSHKVQFILPTKGCFSCTRRCPFCSASTFTLGHSPSLDLGLTLACVLPMFYFCPPSNTNPPVKLPAQSILCQEVATNIPGTLPPPHVKLLAFVIGEPSALHKLRLRAFTVLPFIASSARIKVTKQ